MWDGQRYSKRCRRWDIPGQAHALTFSCYRQRQFLSEARFCQYLIDALNRARTTHAFDLWAYVFMPEHVHLVIYPKHNDYSVSRILQAIKQPVSRKQPVSQPAFRKKAVDRPGFLLDGRTTSLYCVHSTK